MKVVAIVQARMRSTRLPGKVLMEISGKPMLEHVIERLKRAKTLDGIVIATTTNNKDKKIIEIARKCRVGYFAGSEADVLGRYLKAAIASKADIIVRITSDCPLIDPQVVDEVVQKHIVNRADYTSNTLQRNFPRGLDAEVFNVKGLREIHELATQNYEREHVTPYFYQHPDMFEIQSVESERDLQRPEYRLCVDTKEDLSLVREIYRKLNRKNGIVDIRDVIRFLEEHPRIASINAHIRQKELEK